MIHESQISLEMKRKCSFSQEKFKQNARGLNRRGLSVNKRVGAGVKGLNVCLCSSMSEKTKTFIKMFFVHL